MSKIDEINRKIEAFQCGGQSASRVLEIIDLPETTMEDVFRIFEYDIMATAHLLKLCNSSQYGGNGSIRSVREALDHLGKDELKKLISITASTNLFADGGGNGYEGNKGEMRRHSIATAIISRHLSHFAPEMGGDLFTVCLLHDIGKLVLNEFAIQYGKDIGEAHRSARHDFSRAEHRIFGITHAEVSARILERWNFPAEMVRAVRYHHDPEAAPDSPLTHFVALSDRLAMIMGYTTALDGLAYKGFPGLYKKYKLKESHLELVSLNAIDEIKNALPFERRNVADGDGSHWRGTERRIDTEDS